MTPEINFTVSQFIDVCNQAIEYGFTGINVEGEVASFKVNQGKWVFFDLKEGDSSINCFMPLSQLGVALQDGMTVRVKATPRLTRWGKFSLTVQRILPLGEGNIKKSFELLKRKLAAEGLFDPAKKHPLPDDLTKIGVISSTNAAGYIDFLKILDNRWGGLQISTINTQVQGLAAAEQIIHALDYFNQRGQVEVIAILRGGGSADDLAVFNDEQLARAIAASRIPVITGIGHEIDESLADLAADVRASTPSNAAERLTPDRNAAFRGVKLSTERIHERILAAIEREQSDLRTKLHEAQQEITRRLDNLLQHIAATSKILASLNPENVLRRGYAIITEQNPDQRRKQPDDFDVGDVVKITTLTKELIAEVKHAQKRN